MQIDLIPSLKDNYIFVVRDQQNALIVDPGSVTGVQEYLAKNQLTLTHILVTHHHHDHTDGVETLQKTTGAKIYSPADLQEGDVITFGPYSFTAMQLPGHTLDQTVYFEPQQKVLFCGDTLFSLGCGRLFEGTPEQMYKSLERIKSLPPSTRIYGGHEYTQKNIEFSIDYLTKNVDADAAKPYLKLLQMVAAVRVQNHPTIPSRLDFEMRYNLFLKAPTLADFKHVREARDRF